MAIATQGGDFTAAYTEFTNRDLMLSLRACHHRPAACAST